MNLKEIEEYITEIQEQERKCRNQTPSIIIGETKVRHSLKVRDIALFLNSVLDLIKLLILLKFRRNVALTKRIVYTGTGSLQVVNGKFEDRIVKPLFSENIIFINSQKSTRIRKINNQNVYNIGSLIKPLSLFYNKDLSHKMRVFKAYMTINDLVIRQLAGNEVYVICLWEMNTLSLVFSNYRSKIKLIKIQHGSMINYPPYVKPAPIKVADLIYVKSQSTIDFLNTHLCLFYPTEYALLPYPPKSSTFVPGIHLLYASTIEINGLHPVFASYLEHNKDPQIHVLIRLHPREREKRVEFERAVKNFIGKFEFDDSKSWIESNKISNLIVISPWSSILEEAADNGVTAITVDRVGKNRFRHLINNKTFFFSENLTETIQEILNNSKWN